MLRSLILIPLTALALSACATVPASAAGPIPPSTLPSSVTVDDQIGTSVETAYIAASIAERAVGKLFPSAAPRLIVLDNQAFNAVCYTRTAYDVANGQDPLARKDACSSSTKTNKAVSYAQAAQSALDLIRGLVSATQAALSSGQ